MTKMKSLVAKIAFAGVAAIAIQSPSYAIDGMSLEYGTGNSTQLARIGAQFNWGPNWNFWQSNGTHIGGYWDLSLANWRMNHYNNTSSSGNLVDLGLTTVLRFQRDDGKGFYGEAGIGVHLFSKLYRNNDKVLSTAFQFGDHVGAEGLELLQHLLRDLLVDDDGLLGGADHAVVEGLGDQQVVLQGQRLELAGEDHRDAQLKAGHDRRGDAGGLDGDDLGDALVLEAFGEFMADLLHQRRVDLVVEEGVYLEDLFGKNDAFAANFVFESVHGGASGAAVADEARNSTTPVAICATFRPMQLLIEWTVFRWAEVHGSPVGGNLPVLGPLPDPGCAPRSEGRGDWSEWDGLPVLAG